MRGKGSFLLLVTGIVILVLAYGIFMSIASSIDGSSDYNNITAASTNSVYSVVPIVLVIGAIVATVAIVNYSLSTTERYRKTNATVRKIIDFLDKSTYYFAYGLFAYAIFGTIGGGVYLSYRLLTIPGAGGVSIELGKWILIIVTFFFVTAGIGYLFEKYIWKRYKERKRESQAINDLPKVN